MLDLDDVIPGLSRHPSQRDTMPGPVADGKKGPAARATGPLNSNASAYGFTTEMS
jgi:hypothetical protein